MKAALGRPPLAWVQNWSHLLVHSLFKGRSQILQCHAETYRRTLIGSNSIWLNWSWLATEEYQSNTESHRGSTQLFNRLHRISPFKAQRIISGFIKLHQNLQNGALLPKNSSHLSNRDHQPHRQAGCVAKTPWLTYPNGASSSY